VQGGSTVTYKVQDGFCSNIPETAVTITRVTTTATLVFNGLTNHGLSTSDSIVVSGAGAPFDGTYTPASITNGTTLTYTVTNSGPTTAPAGAQVLRIYVGDHPVVTGQTGGTAGNYAFPPQMIRLNATAITAGAVSISINQGTVG
jgi:hypothetical protein